MEEKIKKTFTRSEAGRLGAIALNSDKKKKSKAAKKAVATRKANNPNVFVEMGRKGGSVTGKKKNANS